jgi:hypothetical protein
VPTNQSINPWAGYIKNIYSSSVRETPCLYSWGCWAWQAFEGSGVVQGVAAALDRLATSGRRSLSRVQSQDWARAFELHKCLWCVRRG